ncbi:MAG: PAS domain-containing protein [Bacteroidota bacterium]|nr:PAS domain-containing protein [Bacteroidota bacterium]
MKSNSSIGEFFDLIKQSNMSLLQISLAYQKATNEKMFCSITDTNGIILYVNENFCKTSQYSKEELIGKSHNIVNAGHHSPDFFNQLWETIKSGDVWHGEVKNRAKDGAYYWLDSVIIPVKNIDGEIIHFFSLRTLINEKKQKEEEIERNLKILQEILFMLSHKIRQPIATIIGLSNLLRNCTDSEKASKIVSYIKDSSVVLDDFTRELTLYINEASTTEINRLKNNEKRYFQQ